MYLAQQGIQLRHDDRAESTNLQPERALPPSTKSKLRSTQILTSLPQLVTELVQNSLDASAHHIDVSIDPEEWECWVRDDGVGISRESLGLLAGGSESGRYGTSKAYTPASLSEVNTFGFRGEALASVADLCCLEISSRAKQSTESWSVILKGGKTLYAGPSIRWRRESAGTVVSVRDAFYNLPIRRRSHPNPLRTIELVKKEIEALALVFPSVAFSLESIRKGKENCQTRSKTRILTIPKASSSLATFRQLYGKALASHVEEFDRSEGDVRLDGFVSLEGAYSKAYQFLYINRHPLKMCELHRSIDNVFARSSFTQRRSPRKTEKKPVYVLNLTVSPRQVDNCVDPNKSAVQLQDTARVAAVLASVVSDVLVKHGFLPLRDGLSQRVGVPSPRKKRRLNHNDKLHSLSVNQPSTSSSPVTVEPNGLPSARSLPALCEDIVLGDGVGDIVWTDPVTEETFIIDARTGNSFPQQALSASGTSAYLVPRARRTLDRDSGGSNVVAQAPAWITEALEANKSYRLTERKIPAVSSSADFAQPHACQDRYGFSRALKKHADNEGQSYTPWDASHLARFCREDLRTAQVLGQVDRKFIACIISPGPPFDDDSGGGSEANIEDGRGRDGHALVLIDQHAADERIRVERFLQELCAGFLSCQGDSAPVVVPGDQGQGCESHVHLGAPMRLVDPPVHVLVTRVEAERIAGSQDVRRAFARWGVKFAEVVMPNRPAFTGTGEEETAYVQVPVAGVPAVVADKLLSGEELRDLVKGFLAKLDTEGTENMLQAGASGSQYGASAGWQKALRWCPQELVDLVNSKACRGAIMFNDTLTLEQCKTVVSRLSETALPFQCAHGR
ncbi:hypothetical protein C8Q74DRAFT_1317230 [Fomes fomentarius]|nr:hypothetical protein C8Q74DRAFT_1317230 [Fomes fomentarius]